MIQKLRMACLLCVLVALNGCGGAKAPVTKKNEAPPAEPKKLTHADLLKGMEGIKLERIEAGGPPTFMGSTAEKGGKDPKTSKMFVCLIAYGPPEQISGAYISAGCLKEPAELYTRNMKMLDVFLSNIFDGQVPEEVKKELEAVKSQPDKKRNVVAGGRSLEIHNEALLNFLNIKLIR